MNVNKPDSASQKILSKSEKKSQWEILHQTALKAPNQSGVYMWRNENGTVIYVGKAKNLHNRLSSYFSGTKDIKTRLLISHAVSIEYITTSNEYEAFLLENNLIKKYTPKYNIDLKDGKSYPVLRITKEEFPRIFKTRRVVQDGSLYFGPFPDAAALDTFTETLYEIYPLRHCKTFHKKASPCMYYHIGRCLAPCYKNVKQYTYTEFIEEISSLLEGKGEETVKKLNAQMKEAAKSLNFEKAARLRDGIKALSILQNQNIVESFDGEDRDYISSWREGELVSFTVLKMRQGKLLGRDNYRTLSLSEDNELLPEFISAFYTEKEDVPPKIFYLETEGLENQDLQRWFKETLNAQTLLIPVTDFTPQARLHKAALNMAKENAHEDIIRRLRERGDFPAMEELQKVLNLPKLPARIEGFDIAHIGGKFPVASLISFYNGNPDKKNYRYFRLKTTDGIIDDFQSMREAATRRYTRVVNEGNPLPDLILIDGGIGQVNAVKQVLNSLEIDIPIAGLAKRDEEIWLPGASQPVCLPKRSDALRLLQRVRDETHRFATSRNQQLRTKENTVSPFINLPGVGKERDRLLMKKFATLEKLSLASESEIAQTLHVNSDAASKILLSARELLAKQNAVKEKQKLSLGQSGTTKEKAEHAQKIYSLAQMALEEKTDEKDGSLKVASPE
ncbi:MAG: excinuclease ABC subunit UvrC [Spirochaetales bacterium]|nr:excinuclease ABC subunit UvrC [Spirochaetales bacterium]